MQYKNYINLAFGIILFYALSFSSYAVSENVEVFANNSIAGLDVLLTSSKTFPSQDIVFNVEASDGKIVKIASKTNEEGIAKARLSADYTKVSGIYRLSANLSNTSFSSKVSFLKILASDLSLVDSNVSPSNYLAQTGETVKVDVQLTDVYGNFITNRLIKLIPDDDNLVYENVSVLSDLNGRLSFYVSSPIEKAFNLSFLDIASGKLLSMRSKIAFVADTSRIALGAGNSSGPASVLKIENLPDEIGVLEYVSFTVSAYDTTNQLVNSYKGKVRFSVLSNNAENVLLPADYGFLTADQGSHTFSLALLFKSPGVYKIEVKDLNDSTLKGELEISVVDGVVVAPADSSIILESPLSGTYNSNIQTISGVAQPASKLKIFDNQILLYTLVADFEGNFSYTSAPLVNGSHSLYVAAFDNNDIEIDRSIEVNFVIDTDAPQIVSELLSPQGEIKGGSDLVYTITTNKPVSLAKVSFNGNVFDMVALSNNSYSLNFKAPLIPGTYNLGIELKDSLNNQLNLPNKLSMNVIAADSTIKTVENLTAVGSDRRVILKWDNPDNLNEIALYRVYYGTSPEALVNAVDTFSSSNTWYIPNLQNGLTYYFKVLAVGENSDTSPELSNLAFAEPVLNLADFDSPEITHGVAGADILSELESDVSNTGPGLNVLIGLSFLFSIIFYFRKKILSFI